MDRRLISMMNIYLAEAGIARPQPRSVIESNRHVEDERDIVLRSCWLEDGASCRCIIPVLMMFMPGRIVLDFN